MKLIVNSNPTLNHALKQLNDIWQKTHYCVVTISAGKRTLQANALAAVWYAQVGQEQNEDPKWVKARCKLDYGLPILARDSYWHPYTSGLYTLLASHTYEERVEYMMGMHDEHGREPPITSLMTVEQMQEYMTNLQNHYGQHGIILESNRRR